MKEGGKVNHSRSKKALYNTLSELALQLVTAICGFILPRLVLTNFGSTYNGITHSITQFISCVELLKSGIGSVTRAALYKPLAAHDNIGVSEVVNATEKFMRRVAMIFACGIVIFAVVYPFLIHDEISWLSAFLLVIIISTSTFEQYFFGMTYQMFIKSDQKNYILSIVQIITAILNTIISAILISLGFGIHIVKLGSAVVFIAPPIFYMLYVRKKYNIDKKVKENTKLIAQRWDAFGHQIANFVNSNTDIIVTTIILGVKEVSVYTIYNLIGYSVRKVILSITSGVTAAFGNMYAKNERASLEIRFRQFELVMYVASTILFTACGILFVPFVMIYTRGVLDANYSRPIFAILVCVANYFACMKMPYETMVFAAGQFKQTRNAAFVESILNITVSVVLANVIGLNGIMIGTIVAGAYRTFVYNKYVADKLLNYNWWNIFVKLLYSAFCAIVSYFIVSIFQMNGASGYLEWAVLALEVVLIVSIVSFVTAFVVFKKDVIALIKVMNNLLKTKMRLRKGNM